MPVLDVLMADATNPRSLTFQISHIADLYRKLPRYSEDDLATIDRVLIDLRAFDLQSIDYPAFNETDDGLKRLNRFLGTLENLLPAWSNALSTRYFSHARTLPVRMEL